MKPTPLKMTAKSPRNRWFAYLCVGLIWGAAGWAIAYSSYQSYQETHGKEWPPLILIGILLPFIVVIAEMIRFRRYWRKIPAVLCVDCRHEFDTQQLVREGKCPACGSSRTVGLVSDDDDIVVKLG